MTVFGRWRFRPRPWPTAAAAAMFAVLIALGTWQIQRLHGKEALIADMRLRAQAPPVALPDPLGDPAALEFRRVRLRGRFLHHKEMYLAARTSQGRVGLHVLTPMVLDDGRAVLVDRGWVPPARKAPETRAQGQVTGPVTLVGVVRRGGWRGSSMFRPDNQPGDNLWLWMDLPAMAAWAGLPDAVSGVYVAAGPAAVPGGYPVGGQTRVSLRNDHLQYAITWYVLAAALLVIYVVHQSQPPPDGARDERL